MCNTAVFPPVINCLCYCAYHIDYVHSRLYHLGLCKYTLCDCTRTTSPKDVFLSMYLLPYSWHYTSENIMLCTIHIYNFCELGDKLWKRVCINFKCTPAKCIEILEMPSAVQCWKYSPCIFKWKFHPSLIWWFLYQYCWNVSKELPQIKPLHVHLSQPFLHWSFVQNFLYYYVCDMFFRLETFTRHILV